MPIRNVARGGGKGGVYKSGVTGLKELERKLKALSTSNPALVSDLYKLVGQGAAEVRDQMKSNAQSAGWGSQTIKTKKGIISGQTAIDSIFSSAKQGSGENPRKRISGMAGVSKRRTMVEWIAGKHPRSPRAKVAPGNLVAEGFATMLEFGTTRRAAMPAIRPAVLSAKQRVIDALTEGYNELLAKYSA